MGKRVFKSVLLVIVLCATLISLLTPPAFAGRVQHIAAVQMHVGKFIRTMFTYSVPGDVANFPLAGRYMTSETEAKWRAWYSGWLQNAGFTKSVSEIEVGQVIVNPVIGPGGEIKVRAGVVTYTSILGQDFESSGKVYVVLVPEGDGYGVNSVRHESDEGGVFEVSESGVVVKSAIGEQNFNRMVLDAGS